MTDRDRYVRCLLGQEVDRPPFMTVFGPWGTAWNRWRREGAPFETWGEAAASFGFDAGRQTIPVNAGPCPARQTQVLEESDEFVIWVDTWGIKRRNPKDHESMSEFLEFPVKDWDDWRAYKRRWLDPAHPDRLAGDWRTTVADWTARGVPIGLGNFPDVGVFGSLRWLLGDEECLISFYTQPDLVRDIMNSMTDIYVRVFDAVASEVLVDELHIWEDMSGRQGPLISPAHWEEFMGPCYRRLRDLAERHGIPLMSVDTDGNPNLIVPPMMRNGVNVLYPLEVAAGCDINPMQAQYPSLGMLGGFDKRAIAKGAAAIDAELARIAPAVRRGRYIPTPDHLIPDDVAWENYRYFATALKRLVGKC